jgi:hypothetical protein
MKPVQKTPAWFWIMAVILVVWNAMGVLAYLGQHLMTPEQMALMPEDQRALLEMTPAWATSAFAIAVWGGLMAAILMLLRKAFAHLMFMASMFGAVVQMGYNFFIAGAYDIYGPGGLLMPAMILIIGAYSIYYTGQCKEKGILT